MFELAAEGNKFLFMNIWHENIGRHLVLHSTSGTDSTDFK